VHPRQLGDDAQSLLVFQDARLYLADVYLIGRDRVAAGLLGDTRSSS
jgi:hypothetical protein